MNKFKKIGLTALATSLVASSAYAIEISTVGNLGLTFVTESGDSGDAGDHGKGFGTDNSMSFTASGELDNGWGVSSYITATDAFGQTSNAVTLTMGSMGSLAWGYSYGGNAGNYDDAGAGAYEEVDDGAPAGLSHNQIGSTSDNAGISYTSPTLDAGGTAVTVHIGYTPRTTDTNLAGGAASGVATLGSSQSVGVSVAHDSGLKLGVYGNEINRLSTAGEDSFHGAWYAKYAMGPISIGYAQSYVNNGVSGSAAAATTAKTFAAATGQFEGQQYVVTLNVNENLSVSYAQADDEYDAKAGTSTASTTTDSVADVTMSMKSIQAAYSMGSMSIKAYRSEFSNIGYNSNAKSNSKNEIALGLSF